MPAFRHRIIATRGGVGGWRDVGELNDEEHWLRFNDVFDRVLGWQRSRNLTLAILRSITSFIGFYI